MDALLPYRRTHQLLRITAGPRKENAQAQWAHAGGMFPAPLYPAGRRQRGAAARQGRKGREFDESRDGTAVMPLDAAPAAPGAGAPVLRCQVRLPMQPRGWDTVLARCDGRPVFIGARGRPPPAPGTDAAQYARDMQVIVQALSRPAPAFPAWLAVLGALLGAGSLFAIFKLATKVVARRLPRRHPFISHPR